MNQEGQCNDTSKAGSNWPFIRNSRLVRNYAVIGISLD